MRLLHTSDWHLGRTLHGVSLHEAQSGVLDRICELVEDPPDGVPVDAVLVAGDVYDRGVPPVESVQLFEWTLSRLSAVTTVVVTSGNHDSAIRLGYGSAPLPRPHPDGDRPRRARPARAARGQRRRTGRRLRHPLPRPRPRASRPGAAVARSSPAPTRPSSVRPATASAPTSPTASASARVVLAHAFVAGAEPSDSERSIMVGGVDRVAGTVFARHRLRRARAPARPPVARVRRRAPSCATRGSPLRYSFSEQDQAKVVLLVDLPAAGPVEVTPVEIAQPRPMATLRGRLDDLLDRPGTPPHEYCWVRVTVTDRVRPDSLMDRLKSRFPHALQVFHEPEGAHRPRARGHDRRQRARPPRARLRLHRLRHQGRGERRRGRRLRRGLRGGGHGPAPRRGAGGGLTCSCTSSR